jgi:hypothetical protein
LSTINSRIKSCCFADSVRFDTGFDRFEADFDRFEADFDRFGAGLELVLVVLAYILALPFGLVFWRVGFDFNGFMAPLEQKTNPNDRTPIGGTVGVQSRTDLLVPPI